MKNVFKSLICILFCTILINAQSKKIIWTNFGGYQGTDIISAAFSRDGKTLIIGEGRRIVVWDLKDGVIKKVFGYYKNPTTSVCISPNDSIIAASTGKVINFWAAKSFIKLGSLTERDIITEMHFTNDWKTFVTVTGHPSYNYTARLWDFKTKKLIRDFTNKSFNIYSADLSSSGRYLVLGTGAGINAEIVWDLKKNKIIQQHQYNDELQCVRFSPDNRFYAGGCSYRDYPAWMVTDTLVRVRDFQKDSLILGYENFSSSISNILFSPRNDFVLSVSADGYISIQNPYNNKQSFSLKYTKPLTGPIAFSRDGKYLVTGIENSKAAIWDFQNKKIIKILDHNLTPGYPASSVWDADYSPDGSFTASVDNSIPPEIILWNPANGKMLWKITPGTNTGNKLSISRNSKFIAYGNKNKLELWDVKKHKSVKVLTWQKSADKYHFNTNVSAISFSPDNKYVLEGSIDGYIRAWNINSGKSLGIYHNPVFSRLGVFSAIFDDNSNVIIAGYDHYILGWDVAGNKIIYKLKDDSLKMQGVTNLFKLNSDTLLSINHDEYKSNCRVWDLKSRKIIKRFQIAYCENAISVSPDKKYIASSYCGDKIPSLKIWNISTGKLIHTILTHYIKILAIAWSPDGQQIFTGSTDGTLTMWKVPNG